MYCVFQSTIKYSKLKSVFKTIFKLLTVSIQQIIFQSLKREYTYIYIRRLWLEPNKMHSAFQSTSKYSKLVIVI